jgi:hypothetical protein
VAKVAGFILAQFAQQLAQLGRGVVAQLGFLGGELFNLVLEIKLTEQEKKDLVALMLQL